MSGAKYSNPLSLMSVDTLRVISRCMLEWTELPMPEHYAALSLSGYLDRLDSDQANESEHLREELAELQHELLQKVIGQLFEQGVKFNGDGSVTVSRRGYDRLKYLQLTEYRDLSYTDAGMARQRADKILGLFGLSELIDGDTKPENLAIGKETLRAVAS